MTSIVLSPDSPGEPQALNGPLGAPRSGPGVIPGEAVTLAAVERGLGMRVGPFGDLTAEQGLAPTEVQVGALRSTAELGGWENLFLLRRGVYAPGTATPGEPVPGFDPRDRVRMVKTYTSSSGSLEVDQDYVSNVVPGERLELHVLHPEWELRPAVLAGLERAFLFDRVPLLPNGATSVPGDLTAAYPWLTEPSQVWGVDWTPVPGAADGTQSASLEAMWGPMGGWDAVQRAGGVFLVLPGGAYPADGVRVAVRRPAWSVVNGADWVPGHEWRDDDVLEVALPYACAAALVEAWNLARPRLVPMTQTGMWPTQAEAAAVFTRMTARWFRPDMRQPEDRLPGASRRLLSGGGHRPHWEARSGGHGGSARIIVNGP